jgi:cell wall-associated NlpC family hydrolase
MSYFTGKVARVLFLGAVATLMLAATAFASEIGVGVGSVSGSSVRMRSGPSTSTSIITTMDKETKVSVLEGSVDGWYKIAYNGNIGYISDDYLDIEKGNDFTAYGRVNSDDVCVRSGASTSSSIKQTVDEGVTLTVTGFTNGWYSVKCKYGTEGYIRSDLVDLVDSLSSGSGSAIVDTAKQYLGVRYVYGGASPSGFDCSGFTMYVYAKYGVSLPHSATSQWQSGKGTKVWSISALEAGDLVFFCDPSRSNGKACSHTGIYIGDGQFIHSSSSSSGGVIISSLYSGYYNNYFVGGLSIL